MDDAKNFFSAEAEEKRERRRGRRLLVVLSSSHITASMDVDSDADDEIIAERGTIACILIFHDARARMYFFFSHFITFDDDDERKGGDL